VTGLAAAGDGGQFRLTGPAGFRQAAALLAAGERLFASAPAVTVDLTGVTAVDSATLALLLEWQRQGRKRGRPVAFANMPGRLAALAQLSGVAALLAETAPGKAAGP
jgi:phospholipid transport system transporter-binding protein